MSASKSPASVYPDLAGKVALVTGSSRGIGAETARYLAANKVKVVINGRQAEAVERVAAEINASGGIAIGCVADCSKLPEAPGDSLYTLAKAKQSTGLQCRMLHAVQAFEDNTACASAIGGDQCQ